MEGGIRLDRDPRGLAHQQQLGVRGAARCDAEAGAAAERQREGDNAPLGHDHALQHAGNLLAEVRVERRHGVYQRGVGRGHGGGRDPAGCVVGRDRVGGEQDGGDAESQRWFGLDGP